jgi:hypothetical protein
MTATDIKEMVDCGEKKTVRRITWNVSILDSVTLRTIQNQGIISFDFPKPFGPKITFSIAVSEK